ncbi:MAG: putative virulence factor [Prevotellaceae bacterium]|jgi:hypothetical protein|nr:putative virulence factor [Prevotellaceae bacterium]
MEQKINTQLETIEKSNKWVLESLQGEKQRYAYRNLVNFRRKLNRKKFALESNPAAAMYGESQMGKSYLVSSLLSKSGKPFTVIDGRGNSYDFINKINPIGKGTESTSLVTRFSTGYKWKNPAFPVKAKLLSPADLVLVLCDSYYNDVKAKIDIALKSDTVSEKVAELCNRHESGQAMQMLLGEDDILDIYDYFHSNFSTRATNVIHSEFFEKIPSLIAKTAPGDWSEIFALLWNNNKKITELFSELLRQYGKLDFTDVVYLPIDTVLRDNGTLLDVARLHEIYGKYEGSEPNYKAETPVMILKNGQEKTVANFSKSYLCALTAELIFCLPSELETDKQFLKNTDLLDFPGARHRLETHEEDIDDKVIPKMLLRGKVAYLFNKYSCSEKINILLFCHSDRQSAQSAMPEMLNNWIGDMIGKTPEERNAFIDKSKAPPLFVVSTMFNLDLQFDFNNDREGNRNFLDNRWERRFLKVLEKEIFGRETYSWIDEWTTARPNFQNIYLLRDFYYSSETNSKIYEGYNENKIEKQEIIPPSYVDFRKDLRQSFIEYDFVKRHFENPAHSWDRAASINEDGTQLIIDKLTLAANNINDARREKNIRELNAIALDMLNELKKYFHDSDSDAMLQKAKSTAGNIQANLDIAFGQNPYFFGKMMKELMLPQCAVYNLYLEKIRNIERRDVVNMDKYSAIRMNVPDLDPNDSFDVNLERLRKHYEKTTVEECQEYFTSEGIDLDELFYGNNERVKNFSQVLAEALEVYWFEQYMPENRQNLSKVFSETGLQDIQDMLRALFKKLQIANLIAERIRRYVDGYRNIEDVYEMIADISAEIINRFINSVGFDYLKESDFADLKQANEKNGLNLILDHTELEFEQNSRKEAAELITKMGNLPELLNKRELSRDAKRLPNYRNYIIWYDLMKAGFISVCNIPNYDVQANNKLKLIIDRCKNIQY